MNEADNLNVYQDGKGMKLMDWIQEKGEMIYKDVSKQTWRVPPVKFNFQVLKEQKLVSLENNQQNISIEGRVLGQPKETDQETNRAENFVCCCFEKLSNDIIKSGRGSAMFLILNFEYDSYLNKLSHFIVEMLNEEVTDNQTNNVTVRPKDSSEISQASRPVIKLPKDVARRGELDMLILHKEAGVVLVQTKSNGYNFMNKSSNFEKSSSVKKAIEKAGEQLIRDRKVMLHIMEDLGLKDDQITAIVALPNLSRKILLEEMSMELKHKVKNEFNLDLDANFLCEEDLKPDIDGCHKALAKWWENILLPSAKGMNLETMQQIAFRTVGLMSTVGVWSYAQPRIEVRNRNEAAWETGHRYTQVVLSPQQVEILKHEEQYMYLWGPAGSGKTLLLALKGRQWLRRDRNVAILNTRLGSRGRTVGQVIEATINKSEGLKKTAIRIDLDLMDNEETLFSVVAGHVKDQVFHFLLDEIAWVEETEKLLLLLKKYFPNSSIWCAGMLIECQPEGFEPSGLEVILRCPPSVQRVLRIVDNREERCDLYKLDSAKAGLPTDGLPAFFIIHSRHGDSSIQPYDCPICAKELSDFLINHLNMKSGKSNKHSTNHEISETGHQECNQSDSSKPSTNNTILTSQSECVETSLDRLHIKRDSDSGCDVEFSCKDNTFNNILDLETGTSQDINSFVKNKDRNTNGKPSKNNNKNNKSNGSQNTNSNGVNGKIIDTQKQHMTPDFTPRSTIQNFNTTMRENDNKTKITEPDVILTQAKAHKKKRPKRNKKPTVANDGEESVAKISGKGTTRKKENSTSSKCDQENNDKNQNIITSDCHVSKKERKSKPKNKDNKKESSPDSSIYPRLNFRDAVLPVTVPSGWHHFNKRGYWSISREALAQEMVLLGSRAFCQELYYSGVPLKVEEAMVMKAEGKEVENHFVMCPLGAVHGLEYKLVICVPSACDLPEYIEISEGIRHGKMEPKVSMKRTQYGTDYVKRQNELSCEEQVLIKTINEEVPQIDKIRMSTHVAEQGEPYDHLYEPLSEGDIDLVSAQNLINSESKAASPVPYVAPTYTEDEVQRFKNELCRHCGDKDKCVCQYFSSDELAALHRLNAWNRAYVLMCASRCTSVLVLVLP